MKKILISLGFLTLFLSCFKKKEIAPLPFPLETQNGANTFGCYVNGQPFIPKTTLFGLVHPINVTYFPDSTPYYNAGFLSIQGIDARYHLDYTGNVLLQKLPVSGTGEYSLNHVFNCGKPYECDAGAYYNAKELKYYFIENGKLTITKLDTLNKIISGRFYFTAKDTSGNRKEITNGVFDIIYRP